MRVKTTNTALSFYAATRNRSCNWNEKVLVTKVAFPQERVPWWVRKGLDRSVKSRENCSRSSNLPQDWGSKCTSSTKSWDLNVQGSDGALVQTGRIYLFPGCLASPSLVHLFSPDTSLYFSTQYNHHKNDKTTYSNWKLNKMYKQIPKTIRNS